MRRRTAAVRAWPARRSRLGSTWARRARSVRLGGRSRRRVRSHSGGACALGPLASPGEPAHALALGRVLTATSVGVVGDAPLAALAVAGEPASALIKKRGGGGSFLSPR